MKGHLADQKSVLVFQQAKDGNAVLYSFEAKGSLADIHDKLLEDGLTAHTLVPNKEGATVLVVDLDGSVGKVIEKGAARYDAEVGIKFGKADYVGTTKEDGTDREQRDSARASYEAVIEQSPVQRSREVWRRVSDRWGQKALALTVDTGPLQFGPEITEREFDESEHPRDDDGKFAFGSGGEGGSSSGGVEHPGHGYSSEAYVKDGVIHTSNIYDATRALYEGREVSLKQPREVSTLIKHLGEVTKRMVAHACAVPACPYFRPNLDAGTKLAWAAAGPHLRKVLRRDGIGGVVGPGFACPWIYRK